MHVHVYVCVRVCVCVHVYVLCLCVHVHVHVCMACLRELAHRAGELELILVDPGLPGLPLAAHRLEHGRPVRRVGGHVGVRSHELLHALQHRLVGVRVRVKGER